MLSAQSRGAFTMIRDWQVSSQNTSLPSLHRNSNTLVEAPPNMIPREFQPGAALRQTSESSSFGMPNLTISTTSTSKIDQEVFTTSLVCPMDGCGVLFAGKYRKGNCSRHQRQFHGFISQSIICEEPSCGRTFKRKDARLKHYRNHHPHHAGPAVPRGSEAHIRDDGRGWEEVDD
ncbi:hypothetical protein K491DRAFT_239609 [Lophiostoma macrostomum CBS 122681]|uniref:C2H2-type domain-containing protein n=1 Tax=Lophiostoma macrostomum CBS 122681 TaxID=1314788 RepID=A0A6A6SMC3_9PLEO|nr:hypothetical protein K491DRAFT_239609 [Lophiostoma macrostomum CBS 122681]